MVWKKRTSGRLCHEQSGAFIFGLREGRNRTEGSMWSFVNEMGCRTTVSFFAQRNKLRRESGSHLLLIILWLSSERRGTWTRECVCLQHFPRWFWNTSGVWDIRAPRALSLILSTCFMAAAGCWRFIFWLGQSGQKIIACMQFSLFFSCKSSERRKPLSSAHFRKKQETLTVSLSCKWRPSMVWQNKLPYWYAQIDSTCKLGIQCFVHFHMDTDISCSPNKLQ